MSMRTLTAAELLDVWEAGRQQSPLDQATLLLLMAFPEMSWQVIEALPLGRKQSLLIQLRESIFGPTMESVAACPACEQRLEFAFTSADLGAGDYPTLPEFVTVEQDGFDVTVRLPTSADIRAAAGAGERLFGRLVVEVRQNGEPVDMTQLPLAVTEAAAEAVQTADPLSDVTIALTCPACQHSWSASFEAISFFWGELEAWASRTLHTVHLLASRFGWSEGDILAMSAWRRQLYLEMGSA